MSNFLTIRPRHLLWGIFAAGLLYLCATSYPILSGLNDTAQDLNPDWNNLGICIGLLFLGHILRAEKMVLLLRPLQPQCRFAVYRCLAIGTLFNAILPLRLGELIRAHFLGKQLHVSRTAALLTIVFERIVDAATLAAMLFTLANVEHGDWGGDMLALRLVFIAVVMTVGLVIMLHPGPLLLQIVYRMTAILNNNYRDIFRYSIWSGIRFLQIILRLGHWLAYGILSLLMWGSYLASMYILVRNVNAVAGILQNALVAVICFISVALPLSPNSLAAYHHIFNRLAAPHLMAPDTLPALAVMTWAVLTLPTAMIGVFFLFWRKYGSVSPRHNAPAEINRLMRQQGLSGEFSAFLEGYFGASQLVHVGDEMESAGHCQNLKIFTGGSHAITTLIDIDGTKRVRKFSLPQHARKLESQVEWLKTFRSSTFFPQILSVSNTNKAYLVDVEYREDLIPFFDYIHSAKVESSIALLERVLKEMRETVYQSPRTVSDVSVVEGYIKKKVLQKVADAAQLNTEIEALTTYDQLVINGIKFPNLAVSVARIMSDRTILQDLATYEETVIHGDLTVDNILVKDDHFIVIDPNDENDISDSIVDIAKLYQSLHSGYEFLRSLNEVEIEGNSIRFVEKRSHQYERLFLYLSETLMKSLPPHRYRALLFHEAVHYCRMLTYRVTINPATAPVFYSIAVRLFAEFIKQYESVE